MLLTRHQRAWKEMTNTDIGDEGLVLDVLSRGVELAADTVAPEAARGRCNQACASTGVDAIADRRRVQRSALEEHQQVALRPQLQAQATLLDVLEAEQVEQAESVVVARILR